MFTLWLTVSPSLAGGWGLTIIQANAMGTPAVAYNVPALPDSVRHAVTRWPPQPKRSLVGALIGALDELSDPQRRHFIASQARAWAARFSSTSSAERLAGWPKSGRENSVAQNGAKRLTSPRWHRGRQTLVRN